MVTTMEMNMNYTDPKAVNKKRIENRKESKVDYTV